MIRRWPTAIVSRPAVARSRSRLSATFAMANASRHARNRLSARPCKRITTVSWAHACGTSIQRKSTDASVLDIDEHPTTGEDGQRAWSLQQHDLERAEQVPFQVRHARNDLHEHDHGDRAQDDPRRARRSRRHGKEDGIRDEHRQRESHGERDRIRLQSRRERRHDRPQQRPNQHRGNGGREERQSRAEPQTHVLPAGQRQRQRMDVAAPVIRGPGRDRDQQAERRREQGIHRPPRLHRAQQLLCLQRAAIRPRRALQRQQRHCKSGHRPENHDEPRPFPLRIEHSTEHPAHTRTTLPFARNPRSNSTNPSSRSRSITSRTDAPKFSRYVVISGSQLPTTQCSPAPFDDSRVSSWNGGLPISAGAPVTTSRLVPCLSFSMGDSVISRPLSMTATQSHTRSSSCTRWLEMKIVAPRSETYVSSALRMSRRTTGSSPSVGSSSTSSSPHCASASRIMSFAFWPFERRPNNRAASSSKRSTNSAARARSHRG